MWIDRDQISRDSGPNQYLVTKRGLKVGKMTKKCLEIGKKRPKVTKIGKLTNKAQIETKTSKVAEQYSIKIKDCKKVKNCPYGVFPKVLFWP